MACVNNESNAGVVAAATLGANLQKKLKNENKNDAGAGTAATWGARTLQGLQRVKTNALAILVMLLYSPCMRP
jgi:hypothetical protein